jgi:ADP-dependent phosphofructokinase/glucokinase
VGTHYHTAAPPGEAPDSVALAAQLDKMKKANPRLLIHLQYVVPKNAENEHLMLEQMRGRVHSMSLNAAEMAQLLGRMHERGLSDWAGNKHMTHQDGEQPASLLDGAMHLKQAMGLSRVHVHGLFGDMVIVDQSKDPERQVLALMRARQLASMKSANESGEIKSPDDIWPLAPIVEGAGLAAVHAFADELRKRFGAKVDDRAYAQIIDRWWYREPDSGRSYFFVPSRGIHTTPGGTISLGDTIDSGALIHALEPERVKKLNHPRVTNRYDVDAR